MKKSNLFSLTFISLILMSGCARTHQPNYTKIVPKNNVYYNIDVGYEDFKIGKDKYRVIYSGYVTNSQSEVMKFMYKRAEELCKEHGFSSQEYSNLVSSYDDLYAGNKRYLYSADVHCKK